MPFQTVKERCQLFDEQATVPELHWTFWSAGCGARLVFYQSGRAFGFRNQLQDVMAMVHAKPDFLLAASRQFREGDLQH